MTSYTLKKIALCIAVSLTLAGFFPSSLKADFNDITQISTSNSRLPSNAPVIDPTLNLDGSLLVFSSESTNLVTSSDSNAVSDIFLKNTVTGETSRISNAISGFSANAKSSRPNISLDGKKIVYDSEATDLLTFIDTNSASDVFVHDVTTSGVTVASVNNQNIIGNAASLSAKISNDGRYVTFQSFATNLSTHPSGDKSNIFLRDLQSNTTLMISAPNSVAPNGHSSLADISGDGQYIVFVSSATNLVTTLDNNATSDIYLYNRTSGSLTVISLSSNGDQTANGASTAPSISADGRYIVYQSLATNLVNSTDTNNAADIFLYDIVNKTTVFICSTSSGLPLNGSCVSPKISADGSTIVYLSDATNHSNSDRNNTAGDGKFDVFKRNLATGEVSRISLTASQQERSGVSSFAAINNNGTITVFDHEAILAGLTSTSKQIYLHDTSCTRDRDADGTKNCLDECPDDLSKMLALSCGCGFAETDTDLDGTPDCVDTCPTDPARTSPALCGCNTSSADTNGNGVADCEDPTTLTVPDAAQVTINKKRSVTVRIPGNYRGVTYKIFIRQGKKKIAEKSTKSKSAKFNLTQRGRYNANYTISLGNITTRTSRSRKFEIR